MRYGQGRSCTIRRWQRPSDLLRDKQRRRDLKGLITARVHLGESRERRLRIALVSFDHELDAETDERGSSGLERDGERLHGFVAGEVRTRFTAYFGRHATSTARAADDRRCPVRSEWGA